jgi:hypothetical protein
MDKSIQLQFKEMGFESKHYYLLLFKYNTLRNNKAPSFDKFLLRILLQVQILIFFVLESDLPNVPPSHPNTKIEKKVY